MVDPHKGAGKHPVQGEVCIVNLLSPIEEVAREISLSPKSYVPYGEGVAKLRPEAAFIPADTPLPGKLVLVSALTPTPAGEGKTTVSIGLADGLRASSG